jgi:hypothetical protein
MSVVDPDPHWIRIKMTTDPDPYYINPDPQPCQKHLKLKKGIPTKKCESFSLKSKLRSANWGDIFRPQHAVFVKSSPMQSSEVKKSLSGSGHNKKRTDPSWREQTHFTLCSKTF